MPPKSYNLTQELKNLVLFLSHFFWHIVTLLLITGPTLVLTFDIIGAFSLKNLRRVTENIHILHICS